MLCRRGHSSACATQFLHLPTCRLVLHANFDKFNAFFLPSMRSIIRHFSMCTYADMRNKTATALRAYIAWLSDLQAYGPARARICISLAGMDDG